MGSVLPSGSFTPTNGYRDLKVWQKAVRLAVAVYGSTQSFPPAERFGLISQMQRAAVSVGRKHC